MEPKNIGYTTFVKELTNELTNELPNNLNENTKKEIKDIIEAKMSNVDWHKHFNRPCGAILKNGNACSAVVKPGYDRCQRHLTTILIRSQNKHLSTSNFY